MLIATLLVCILCTICHGSCVLLNKNIYKKLSLFFLLKFFFLFSCVENAMMNIIQYHTVHAIGNHDVALSIVLGMQPEIVDGLDTVAK